MPGGRGMRYYAKQVLTVGNQLQWIFEERDIPLAPTQMLLVRIIVAKITDREQLLRAIRGTQLVHNDKSWTCKSWVRDTVARVQANGKAVGTSQLDWDTIRTTAENYCREKEKKGRFNGKSGFDISRAPRYDLMARQEVIP
jgi:hypothetical protein